MEIVTISIIMNEINTGTTKEVNYKNPWTLLTRFENTNFKTVMEVIKENLNNTRNLVKILQFSILTHNNFEKLYKTITMFG